MGSGKENPKELVIENKKLAAHLRAAATRYRNCATYVSRLQLNITEKAAKIDRYANQQCEAETWANILDPEGQESYELNLIRWSNYRHRS